MSSDASTPRHHEAKHAEVHETVEPSPAQDEAFAVAPDSPLRRDHITEPEHPADGDAPEPPQVAGTQPMSKVPGEGNATDTPHRDVN